MTYPRVVVPIDRLANRQFGDDFGVVGSAGCRTDMGRTDIAGASALRVHSESVCYPVEKSSGAPEARWGRVHLRNKRRRLGRRTRLHGLWRRRRIWFTVREAH